VTCGLAGAFGRRGNLRLGRPLFLVAAATTGLASELDIGGKRVGIILTGGNVDLDALPWM